jgi:anti-sigma regulatory factor (Ser/Thr protein kinase)
MPNGRVADDMEVSLEAEPTAAGRARRAVARAGLVGSAQEPTLLLLVSELVSNSVRHAGLTAAERIRLRCRALQECARVEVCDGGRTGGTPRMRERDGDALEPGGLGLHLVDAMADRWGVAHGARETCVWFELDCSEAA